MYPGTIITENNNTIYTFLQLTMFWVTVINEKIRKAILKRLLCGIDSFSNPVRS